MYSQQEFICFGWLGVVMHDYNTWEVEAQLGPGLIKELVAKLGYMRPCLKKQLKFFGYLLHIIYCFT